jgi:cytochrome c-type biogenesis protein CcsB
MLITIAYALLWTSAISYLFLAKLYRRWIGWWATGCASIVWALLTVALVQRGLAAGHWPLTTAYEFALCFTWSILTIYLLLEITWRERRTGAFVLAIALLVASYAITRPESQKEIIPLLPALRSIYLQLHVFSAMVGYAGFGVAAGLGIALITKQASAAEINQEGWIPVEGEIESMMERVAALGFLWLTLGILTGAIWAQNAWGRYWGWDPKETWALITWLWYLLALHIRMLRNWRRQRLAWLLIIGFGVVIFTYIGVPWLVRTVRLESLHGF